MQRRAVLASGATLLTSAVAGCLGGFTVDQQVSESFSNQYDVSPETTVRVSNRNGSVTVQPADGDQLALSGEKRANSQEGLDSIAVDVVTGEQFAINVRFASGGDFSNRSVDLTVGVPEGVAVDAASTTNGTVRVTGVRGDVFASSANGNVEVANVQGYVRAETANGNVTVRGTTGVTGARSTNGNVEVELQAIRGDVSCTTTNGNVTVRVGPDVSAAIRLSTNTGEARVHNLPYTADTDRRGYIVGSLRGGDSPELFLGTNNGDVTLEPV